MSSRLLSVGPAVFVPTLYFIQGLPYTMVVFMSVVMLKNFGAGNEFIGLATSNLTVPWVLKPLWAPLIDLFGTRRSWVLVAHLVLAILSIVLAACALTAHVVVAATVVFAMTAFVSATQDVAMDGYYMDVLDRDKQAFFVGFRNAAYKVAVLAGQGGLVMIAGYLAEKLALGFHAGWFAAFTACAVLFLIAFVFHWFALPRPDQVHAPADRQLRLENRVASQFKAVFRTFFTQPKAMAIVSYILLFRLGDALMLKMTVPFLLDNRLLGGLGISTADEGFIYGTVGMIALLIGGIAGSALIARFRLKRCLMPAAIFQSMAIPLYWLLAVWRPQLPLVALVNAFEQFSYGVGATAYTVYLLSTVRPEYRASHYAIATALMALGLLIPGSVSGYLTRLGYPAFFLISFAASIPGIISILFLPFKETDEVEEAEHGVPQAREMGH